MASQLSAQELQRINEVKTRFLNMAAHELNTPIVPIRLQLHLLSAGALGRLEGPQAKAIKIVERNVERLSELVQDILDVARLEGGKIRLHIEAVPLDQLIRETWESFEEPARRLGLRLLAPAATRAVVLTDRRRTLQILYNLMSNAMKFTPADGEIRITVSRVRRGQAEVCVADTGIGMTQEQVEQLFLPFTRLHEDYAGGTGLGLYISQGFAQRLGTQITASSPGPGHGTTFCFTLPLAPSEAGVGHQDEEEQELAQRLRQLI